MQENPEYEDYKERLTNFSHEFDLGLFIYIIKKSLFWVVMLVVASLVLATLYLRYTPEVYEAKALVQIGEDDSGGRVLEVTSFQQDNGIEARVELIRSKLLIQRTLDGMALDVSYFAKGRILTNEHYILSPYRVEVIDIQNEALRNRPIFIEFDSDQAFSLTLAGEKLSNLRPDQVIATNGLTLKVVVLNAQAVLQLAAENELFFRINTPEALASRFARGVDVRILNNTAKTIEVSYKDNNPFLAKDFVTALSEEFIVFDLEKRQRSDESILAFIDAQIDTVYERLHSSERLLNTYKQDNKITNLSSISGVYLDRMTDLENRIIQLEVEERLLADVEALTSAASD